MLQDSGFFSGFFVVLGGGFVLFCFVSVWVLICIIS